MKHLTLLLAIALFALAACKKESTESTTPTLNAADYKVFRQADNACIVNNGPAGILITRLTVTANNGREYYQYFTDTTKLAVSDTFKYNMQSIPASNGLAIKQNDTTVTAIDFYVFDHKYTRPENNHEVDIELKCSWHK